MENTQREPAPAPRRLRFPVAIVVAAVGLTVGIVAGLGWNILDCYRMWPREADHAAQLAECAARIAHLDEVLTMSARLAVSTGDPAWIVRHAEYEPQLEALIDEAEALAPAAGALRSAEATEAANAALVRMEREAFALLASNDQAAAWVLLTGPEYRREKAVYARGMADFVSAVAAERQQRIGGRRRGAGLAMLLGGAGVLGGVVLWLVAVRAVAAAWRRRAATAEEAQRALRDSEAAERQFRQHLRALHDVTIGLSALSSFDDLCRRAVEEGRARLGFERLGLWFLTDEPGVITGSFGTDEAGAVRDERGISFEIPPDSAEGRALARSTDVLVTRNADLLDDHQEPVGRGTAAVAGLWDGEKIIGLLFADDLLSGSGLDDRGEEVLGLYAAALAPLCSGRRAQETLARERALLSNILEHIPSAVFWKDRHSVYLGCNRRFAETAERDRPDQIVGKTDLDLARDPGEAEAYRADDRRVIDSGESIPGKEEVLIGPGGEPVTVLTAKVPLRDESARIVGVLGIYTDITGRKKAEAALRRSETLYRTTIDAMDAGVHLVDPDLRLVMCNETFGRWCAELGVEAPKVEMHVLEAFPFLPPAVCEEYQQVFRTGRPLVTEETTRVGGQDISTETHKIPLIEGGAVARVITVVRDVTERARAEAALRESETTARALLDASREMAYLLDTEARVIALNRAAAEAVGRGVEEVVGKLVFDLFPPDVADSRRAMVERALRSARPVQIDDERDGRLYDATVYPILDAEGTVRRLAVFARDVTDERRAQETLRESEERFRTVFERSPVGMAMVGPGRRLQRVNRAFCEMLGYTMTELTGANVADITHPDDLHADAAPAEEVASRRSGMFRLEKRYVRKDGQVVLAALTSTVIRDAAGKILYALSVVEDITEQRRAQEALQASEEAERRFGEELAALHEVTVELSAAKSFDDLCRRSVQLGRARLGFDRMGIWFLTDRAGIVQGSFGTDAQGRLADEREETGPVAPDSLMGRVLADKIRVGVNQDWELLDARGRTIGRGALAIASLWDGERILGCICTDNLMTGRPIDARRCELLSLYASALGHLCSRLRAEEAMAESRDRLRYVIENTGDIIFQIDLEGNYTFVNRVAEAITGWPVAELLTMNMRDVAAPEDVSFLFDRLRRRLAGEAVSQPFSFDILHADGHRIPMELTTSPVHDGNRLVAIQGIARDVTERKRREDELRIKDSAIEASINAIALADLGGSVTYVNPAFLKMWGYRSARKVLGESVGSFWQNPDAAQDIVNALAEQGAWTGELVAKRRDGSSFDALLSASMVRSGSGEPICMMSSFADITHRKRAEEALRVAHRHLMTAREAERRRLARELHDSVSQSLFVLQLGIRAVLDECLDFDDPDLAEAVAATSHQCDELIREVRHISHGLYPPTLETIGLEAALREMVAEIQTDADLTFECGVPQDAGRLSADVEIALFRIAQEAVTNAIRHAGAKTIRIRLSYARGQAALSVTDNGSGFSPDEAVGVGLGLNSMSERAQAIGGQLQIASRKGRTCVRVRVRTPLVPRAPEGG